MARTTGAMTKEEWVRRELQVCDYIDLALKHDLRAFAHILAQDVRDAQDLYSHKDSGTVIEVRPGVSYLKNCPAHEVQEALDAYQEAVTRFYEEMDFALAITYCHLEVD